MTILALCELPAVCRTGQRVYAGGRFGNVTNITVQNYHATMVYVDGFPFRPSEVSADVVEFPRRDTAPSEVQP